MVHIIYNIIEKVYYARVAQLVEHHVANVRVASSNLVSRSEIKKPLYLWGFLTVK